MRYRGRVAGSGTEDGDGQAGVQPEVRMAEGVRFGLEVGPVRIERQYPRTGQRRPGSRIGDLDPPRSPPAAAGWPLAE